MNSIQLETPRLIIRTLTTAFAQQLLDYNEVNRDFFEEWTPQLEPDFFTLDYQRRRLEGETYMLMTDSNLHLYAFEKEDTAFKHIVGDIQFSNVVRGAFLNCNLGYKFGKDFNGKGYAQETIENSIPLIFNDWKLHRIEANIMPRNKPSINLIKRLGFEEEGLSKKYLKINGVWEDHIHYVLLNHDLED